VPPTVDKWMDLKFHSSSSATLIIYLIYIAWFMNQFILLVVLLNFVIALISEVYERVMDQRMIHEYRQKQQLNDECDRFLEFLDAVKNITNYGKTVND
jgi:hypothetical protein